MNQILVRLQYNYQLRISFMCLVTASLLFACNPHGWMDTLLLYGGLIIVCLIIYGKGFSPKFTEAQIRKVIRSGNEIRIINGSQYHVKVNNHKAGYCDKDTYWWWINTYNEGNELAIMEWVTYSPYPSEMRQQFKEFDEKNQQNIY